MLSNQNEQEKHLHHHDDDKVFLFNKPSKAFHEYIRTIKDISAYVPAQGTTTTIFIFGFPFDEGTAINNGRVGGERAPFSFRTGLREINVPPFENIDRVSIIDCGNVRESLFETMPLPEAHERLTEKVAQLYSADLKSVPFIIGGSNDQSYQNARGLLESFPEKKIAAINIDAHFDVRPLKDGKKHSGSPFRSLLEDEIFKKNSSTLIEFANQGCQCSKEHNDFILQQRGRIYWLDKHIRRHKLNLASGMISKTQAGQVMETLLGELQKEGFLVFFSFDIDSINSMFCPGVSAPSVVGGLTEEEALELCYLAGRAPCVKLMDCSEFNPAVEDVRTRRLLGHMFFNFSKGISER